MRSTTIMGNRIRRVIDSVYWNTFGAIIILINIIVWIINISGIEIENSLLTSLDSILFVIFSIDVLMRVFISKPKNFLFINHNRSSLFITIFSLISLILHTQTSYPRLDIIQGFLVGAMINHLFWIFSIFKPTLSFDNEEDHYAVKCLRTLETLRDRLKNGFDTELGLSVEDINFVIEAIREDNLYSNKFDKAIQDPNLENDQGDFLRAVFGAAAVTPAAKDDPKLSGLFQIEETPDQEKLREIGTDWNFDAFSVHNISESLPPLVFFGHHVFTQLSLTSIFSIDDSVLIKWLKKVNDSYLNNPYHNATHACDILQIVYYHFTRCGFATQFSSLEILGAVIAAIIHDIGHVGVTNGFLKMTFHDLAIRYNDSSILENMHASEGWSTCTNPKHNIFENLTTDQIRFVRELVIAMVLDTDMARHSKLSEQFAAKRHQGFNLTLPEDRKMVLSMLLHCADLGNGARNFDVAKKWAERVMEEFFNQGDREKQLKLPVTANMDRDGGEVLIAKCQMTFLNYVVAPLYKEWCEFLRAFATKYSAPTAAKVADMIHANVSGNYFLWLTRHNELTTPKENNNKKRTEATPSRSIIRHSSLAFIQKSPLQPKKSSQDDINRNTARYEQIP
eukprot:c21281_g2_i1.p1 GENE.c21281_g2_i1~~c21281_g2_i1.p1  ORF type:complete len:621 (+),score=183.42 c21281_g2_i1:29-1891(+)